MPKPTPKGTPAKKPDPKPKADERKVIYPAVKVSPAWGENALTATMLKDMLGWEEETEQTKFGADYLFLDKNGNKVRLTRNTRNRPFYDNLADGYMQTILSKKWAGPNGRGSSVNGESMIFGKYGEVISAQHRGVGCVWAQQILDKGGEVSDHWKELWPDGIIKMDSVVVVGVDEDPDVVQTVDTGKSRSEGDMLYTHVFFASLPPKDRKVQSSASVHTIRFLWNRTGAKGDPFAPRLTYSEVEDFINRHPRIAKAVKHISEENGENRIGQYVSVGYAAGMLYLMGCSDTDPEAYGKKGVRSEKQLDWSQWDKAQLFWTLLGSTSSKDFKEVRWALGGLKDPDNGMGGTRQEKTAIIARAWAMFKDGKKFKADCVIDKDHKVIFRNSNVGQLEEKAQETGGRAAVEGLVLEYSRNADGIANLESKPTFEGVDKGEPKKTVKVKAQAEETTEEGETEATEAEVEAAKVKAANGKKAKAEPVTPPSPSTSVADDLKAELKVHRDAHLGRVILLESGGGVTIQAMLSDASDVQAAYKTTLKVHAASGLPYTTFPASELDKVVAALALKKKSATLIRRKKDGTTEAMDLEAPKPSPAPAAKGKGKPGLRGGL